MSCNTYNSIIDCSLSVGGLSNLYIFPFGSVYDYSYTDDNLSKITDYKIDILGAELKVKDASTFNEVLNRDGADVYVQTLSLTIQKMEWEKRVELFKIIRGDLTIIFKDGNGKCWIVGRNSPIKISEFNQTTDAIGGNNLYSMVLTCRDLEPVKEISCYDSKCAISVNGQDVRRSFFLINNASTFDFSGNYELLGDLITRTVTPINPLNPTNWTTPTILASDIATIRSIVNPNGNTIVELFYNGGSDIALIVLYSIDTTYPFMSIGLQPLMADVSIDVNLVTTFSTSLTGVSIRVEDELSNLIYDEPAGGAVTGTGLSGISENSFINVSTLYPLGQTFTVSVQFNGDSCTFSSYQYTYEPSNECQLINNYTIHNGKHYSVVVEKLTATPTYRELTIVIGEYQFNLYNNFNDYHSSFNTLQTHIINSLNNYPSLDIQNITVTEQPKTWTLTFDSLTDDNLDVYVYTRGNDSTFINAPNTRDLRKYLSNRSTILALQTNCPSDSDLIITNTVTGSEINGLVNQYPLSVINERVEDVAPFTNNVTNSLGIDVNDWEEPDIITVQNESLSCPDVLNSLTIDTCLDLVEHTDDNKLYLFSIQTTNIGDSVTFDTAVHGLITVLLPSDITPANYPDFGDYMKTLVPSLFSANLQFDAITETFYLEVLTIVANDIYSVTADNTSTPFVQEYMYQENVYNIQTKQHPNIGVNWTTDTFEDTGLNLIGKVKTYSNTDKLVDFKYCDFNYNSTLDIFEVNSLFNSATQGYTFEFFYAPFPATPRVADYVMVIPPTNFNESVSSFSTLVTVTDVRYIRIRNGQGYEQIIRWDGSTEQNLSIDVNYKIIFKKVYGRFDNFKVLYDYGVPHPTPFLIRTSINCPNTDILVLNFLAETGITDPVIETALDVFVTTLRTNNIIHKCKAIYPFVGGTAFTHKFNLLNPLDSAVAFRLTFFGGWTHNSNGITPNGVNAYADTHYVESFESLGLDNKHISIYSRLNLLGQWTDMAAYNGTDAATDISPRFFLGGVGSSCLVRNGNVAGSNYPNTNSFGLFVNNRIDTFNVRVRQNSSLVVVPSVPINLVNVPYFIGANNFNGVAGSFSIRNLAYSSIGDGFTDAESLIYYNAVQALQTALGRQV